jgi:hypothetical protein
MCRLGLVLVIAMLSIPSMVTGVRYAYLISTHVGAQNPGFLPEGNDCPTSLNGYKYGWHFVLEGETSFSSIQCTFKRAGIVTNMIQTLSPKHAFVFTPTSDILVDAWAVVEGMETVFILTKVCFPRQPPEEPVGGPPPCDCSKPPVGPPTYASSCPNPPFTYDGSTTCGRYCSRHTSGAISCDDFDPCPRSIITIQGNGCTGHVSDGGGYCSGNPCVYVHNGYGNWWSGYAAGYYCIVCSQTATGFDGLVLG